MNLQFEAKVVLRVTPQGKHGGTDINLITHAPVLESMYFDNEGVPNKDGSKALSNVLIQGLVANVHASHERKYRDSAEHLRWIISELERGFVTVSEVTNSNFEV